MYRRLLGLLALFLLAIAPANASAYGRIQLDATTKATYSAGSTFTTPAASTTDFWQIYGSSTKTIKVLRVEAAYTSGNTSTSDEVFLIKRSTANSGGTSSTVTSVPLDSTNSAATAVVRIYTANPTTGTSVGTVASGALLSVVNPGTAYPIAPSQGAQVLFDHRLTGQPVVLRGTGEGLVLNFAGTIPASSTPKIAVTVFWTEE